MTHPTIDLRSDTVTLPSPAMRRAMAAAELGDDVYGEDPTVNRLQAMTAERLGKEAALFVPSGTMGNLIAQLVHCRRGEQLIAGDQAHTVLYEAGGSAAVGGIHPRTVTTFADGTLDLAEAEALVAPENPHFPRTKLLILENTHNRTGGQPLPLDFVEAARTLCDAHGLALHCDGARLWNAAIALGETAERLAQPFDSLSVCLSKGLAAPVGSLVVGRKAFIAEALRERKLLGGGMRQAGVLAAAGIVALTEMQTRLADDHNNAARLAEGLAALGYRVRNAVTTNILFFAPPEGVVPSAALSDAWAREGLLISPPSHGHFRAVTHYGISAREIDRALQIIERAVRVQGA
ncbi:MAG: low-specificity L-threonine aldolase [Ardenticatenales bacterium]|nr:low-specificity L-threonine aldolase [Ardenticatenales bacterium]MCB9172427.1 low-specificity L-threonine aldolase [Ardenticatenales bacterium]